MSAFESAIDDSFDPPPQPIEDEETDDESFFDNAYNGPRDGRWEVASSVGSFVDDRCPTVYGYRPQTRPAGRETRIDDGLVKKLMQATVEHKRAEAATLARQTVTVGGAPTDNGKAPSAPPSVKVSRPFFVPPLRNKPYIPMVASRQGDQEHIQKANSAQQFTKANNDFQATATREVAATKSVIAKAQSDTPQRMTPDRSTIRILGKNGEEAFISLPSLVKSVHASSHRTQQRSEVAVPVSRSRVSAEDFQPDETVAAPELIEPEEQDQNQNQEQNKRQKNRQKNNKQKKLQDRVEQLITESPQVEEVGSQRAASWVMSGALPAPSREPSQAPHSAANSMRDSGVAMSDFIASVKAASSRASSVRPENPRASMATRPPEERIGPGSTYPSRGPGVDGTLRPRDIRRFLPRTGPRARRAIPARGVRTQSTDSGVQKTAALRPCAVAARGVERRRGNRPSTKM